MIKSDGHSLVFFVLLTASLVVGVRPVIHTFALSWRNDAYTHILLVLPVCLVLILLRRQRLQKVREWDFCVGPFIVVIAAAIACSARWGPVFLFSDELSAIEMCALVLAWIGIFAICLGVQACRSVLFPLLFLFGLVPIPNVTLNLIISWLQQGSAWSTHALFALFNVPVIQRGVMLTIPGLTIQVAPECSSIRSSSMLFFTALVMAYVLLHSPWRRALVILLAIPLSIAKNALRIFTIAMLGTRMDPGYLTGRLHHQGGELFFIIALIVELAILLLLRREEALSPVPHLEVLRGSEDVV